MRVSNELNAMSSLPQLFRTQILQLVNINIGVPYSHVGNVRFTAEESFEGGDVAGTQTHGSVNCIYSCGKCICPEEVYSSLPFQPHHSALVCAVLSVPIGS